MKSLILTFAAMNFLSFLARAEPLSIGTPAPALTATNQDGKPLDFATTYKKGLTLIYFYPKAGTPGCTAQACSLRDSISDLTAVGVQVIGVSNDSVAAQKKFQEKYKLPFPLIADTDGKVATAFGVDRIPLVNMTKRESFLVKDGQIAWVNTSAQTAKHADEVRAAVKGLK